MGEILRSALIGILCGVLGVLAFEPPEGLRNLWRADSTSRPAELILPPAVKTAGSEQQSHDPREFILADETVLREPIRFTLRPDGIMLAQGSIDEGAARRLAATLETNPGKVRRLALNSPGGSLDDAIAMAAMLRRHGIDTMVPAGGLCASSCPLLMAGGVRRLAGEKAAIGVHQFYSVSEKPLDPAQAMADAQSTAARIARHLASMGVDPQIWLHALDTPPRALYYFSPGQMSRYRLVTEPVRVSQLN